MSSHLPPMWGVILAKVIYLKKSIRLKRGLQMIYFSLVKRLSKMTFIYFKLMHLGSVSLAFMRVYNVIFSLLIQIKLSFWSHFMVLFFVFFPLSLSLSLSLFRFSRCMVTFLRNHLNFQNLFVSDKHQHDFCFLY